MDETVTDEELIDALRNEADLCRNDGADDVAILLDAAAKRIGLLLEELYETKLTQGEVWLP